MSEPKTWDVKIEILARGTATVEAETAEEAEEEAKLAGVGFRGNWTLSEYDETTLEVVSVEESKF
jgi:hypothetical protein